MAEISRELSQEFWRPAPNISSQLQAQGFPTTNAFCANCGTPYPEGARYCHLCGANREEDLHAPHQHKGSPLLVWMKLDWLHLDWLNLEQLRAQSGLSTLSLTLALAAGIFLAAALMTGLLYRTATLAEWQAVQVWRIEWLLASVVMLLGALLFRK